MKPTGAGYSEEARERAVRLVLEHRHEYETQGAAMCSIASKMGMSRETRKWVIQAGRDRGQRAGTTTTDLARLKELERENRELRMANKILRKASAYFAQAEFDRRPKSRSRLSTIIVQSTGPVDLPVAADRPVDILSARI